MAPLFMTSALDEGLTTAFHLRSTPRGNRPRYQLDRRLGGPKAGLEAVENRKILQSRESNLGHPARRYTYRQLTLNSISQRNKRNNK
jgi:hypothetical protein